MKSINNEFVENGICPLYCELEVFSVNDKNTHEKKTIEYLRYFVKWNNMKIYIKGNTLADKIHLLDFINANNVVVYDDKEIK